MKIQIQNSPAQLDITKTYMPLLTNLAVYLVVGIFYFLFAVNRNNVWLFAGMYIFPMMIFVAWAYKLFFFDYRVNNGVFEVSMGQKKIETIPLNQLKVLYQDFNKGSALGRMGRGNFIFVVGDKKYKIVNVSEDNYKALLDFFTVNQVPLIDEKV